MTATTLEQRPATGTGTRIIGVDVARGVALLGMMAVHIFESVNDNGTPTVSTLIAGGRSAATFVFVAGVSLAFLSGGRRGVQGHRHVSAAAGIAVRAVLIGVVGLALGLLPDSPANIILQYYALMFLLSLPLLGLRPRTLAWLSAAIIVVGPLVLYLLSGAHLPFAGGESDPGTLAVLRDPLGLPALLFVTGTYPVLAYMSYLCAGLAVGRLDLTSTRVAQWLLGGGLVLAVSAKTLSWILLGPAGGMAHLVAAHGPDAATAAGRGDLLWEGDLGGTWWSLALTAPHSNTPLDLIHTLGSAMAVLGGMLLLTRLPRAARILQPVALAGSMTLTLYSAHLVILSSGWLDDSSLVLYLVTVAGSLLFAVLYRYGHEQGPLEWIVAELARRARRAVSERLTGEATRPTPPTSPWWHEDPARTSGPGAAPDRAATPGLAPDAG